MDVDVDQAGRNKEARVVRDRVARSRLKALRERSDMSNRASFKDEILISRTAGHHRIAGEQLAAFYELFHNSPRSRSSTRPVSPESHPGYVQKFARMFQCRAVTALAEQYHVRFWNQGADAEAVFHRR